MRWSTSDIADAVAEELQCRAAADDLEQTVYGFDALDELGLHPIIQAGLRRAGYGVWPEQRYPAHWGKRKKSHGLRCDIVLTHDGLPLRDPDIKDTLFDGTPSEDPEAAYWLEIKTVAQFETAGPFRRYSSELLSPVAKDIRKIWSEGVIQHGGLLLVLFTVNREVAEHDLHTWHERCIQRGLPAGPPSVRGLPITDRIGNGWCAVAVYGVRGV